MNICAKINSMAAPNEMVIGNNLYCYCITKIKPSSSFASLFDDYNFKRIGDYSVAGVDHHPYPVYSVSVSKKKNRLLLDSIITPTKTSLKLHRYHDYDQQLPQRHRQKQRVHNILLVDDEPDTLFTYKTFLSDIQDYYNVDVFTDSQKSLQKFAQANPSYYDLVVMDIRMPGLNGLQLYYRLKAINPNIRVLFISALDAAEEMVSILPDVKLEDIIRKPVDKEQFIHSIQKLNTTISHDADERKERDI
jgi:CheY-like chemotaxis protein